MPHFGFAKKAWHEGVQDGKAMFVKPHGGAFFEGKAEKTAWNTNFFKRKARKTSDAHQFFCCDQFFVAFTSQIEYVLPDFLLHKRKTSTIYIIDSKAN